jgi:hypothetical protein
MIKRLLLKLRWSLALIDPIERAAMDALTEHLSPEPSRLLTAQIATFQSVTRLGRRETLYYTSKGGNRVRDPAIAFPDRRLEVHFATVTLSSEETGKTLKVKFTNVRGYLFQLLFDRETDVFLGQTLRCQKVAVHADPMISQTEEPLSSESAASPPGWILEWGREHPLEDLKPPLIERDRAKRLAMINGSLPMDYLELVEGCEGCISGSVSVFGLGDVYEVPLDYGTFTTLGEVHDSGMLGVNVESTDRVVYFAVFRRACGDRWAVDSKGASRLWLALSTKDEERPFGRRSRRHGRAYVAGGAR